MDTDQKPTAFVKVETYFVESTYPGNRRTGAPVVEVFEVESHPMADAKDMVRQLLIGEYKDRITSGNVSFVEANSGSFRLSDSNLKHTKYFVLTEI